MQETRNAEEPARSDDRLTWVAPVASTAMLKTAEAGASISGDASSVS